MAHEEARWGWKNRFLTSAIGQWIYQYRYLAIQIGICAVVLGGIVSMSRSPSINALRQTREAFAAWQAKPEDDALFKRFEQLLKKTPQLKRTMAADGVQVMAASGRVDDAQRLMRITLTDLRQVSPEYAEFSEISLLIARKCYQEALERSVSLKEKCLEQSPLFSRNLVRIAFLHQQMSNPAGELAAWLELRHFNIGSIGLDTFSKVSFQTFLNERTQILERTDLHPEVVTTHIPY
jgi:hypothetical protein